LLQSKPVQIEPVQIALQPHQLAYEPFWPQVLKPAPKYDSLPRVREKNATQIDASCVASNLTRFWDNCDPKSCNPNRDNVSVDYPRATAWGEDTGEFVNRVMREAWGPNPPHIDLYVRAGCNAGDELKYLMLTVELFWPRFLGDIVIVLDYGNDVALEEIMYLSKLKHSAFIVYEHCPCNPARVFNQYSYITLDRHSDSQFVVTIDSDCAFHTPVTPDVLFNDRGELKLAVAFNFQKQLWANASKMVTGVSNENYGHAMVTQPVAFITSTLPRYREWIWQTRGRCYENVVAELVAERSQITWFCWMCQLNVFVEHTNVSGYDVHAVERRSDVYVRYAIHTPYEAMRWSGKSYQNGTDVVVQGGLCLWFGERVFPNCKYGNDPFLHKVFWTYTQNITQHVTAQTKNHSIATRQARLANIVDYLRGHTEEHSESKKIQ
jgi:hypothetical protein